MAAATERLRGLDLDAQVRSSENFDEGGGDNGIQFASVAGQDADGAITDL